MAKHADKLALERFVAKHERELASIVARVTGNMRSTVTVEQVKNALLSGVIDDGWVAHWRELYGAFVANELSGWWQKAMAAQAARDEKRYAGRYAFNHHASAVLGWAQERAATLVTDISGGQRNAIRAVVRLAVSEVGTGVDELAVLIRPMIGLTVPQAEANYRFFERVRETLMRDHPRMGERRVNEIARNAAARYAEHQHRARAASIARTELVTSYNAGRYFSVGQQMAEGLLPRMKTQWVTADDDRVCKRCKALDGVTVAYGEKFVDDARSARYSEGLFPPLHTKCRCVAAYIEDTIEDRVRFDDGNGQ